MSPTSEQADWIRILVNEYRSGHDWINDEDAIATSEMLEACMAAAARVGIPDPRIVELENALRSLADRVRRSAGTASHPAIKFIELMGIAADADAIGGVDYGADTVELPPVQDEMPF